MIVGNVKNIYTDMASYNSTEKVTVKNTETTVSKAATEGVIYSTEKLLEKESRLYDKTGKQLAYTEPEDEFLGLWMFRLFKDNSVMEHEEYIVDVLIK